MKPPKDRIDAAITHFPSPIAHEKVQRSDEEKITQIAKRFEEILDILGLDLNDKSIAKTPFRIAKMYVQEIFSGLDTRTFPPISFTEDEFQESQHTDTIFVKVNFTSFCEHHFVPMIGTAFVSYVPRGKFLGLSKIPRLVKFFARRPQMQERLTAQIADSLSLLLNVEDVAVSIIAQHYCVIARGVEDESGHMITNVLRGEFETNQALRREFFEGVNRQHPS